MKIFVKKSRLFFAPTLAHRWSVFHWSEDPTRRYGHRRRLDPSLQNMDQITIKTSNPKCLLYCCLIEFIDWRYSQSCWYFRPVLWTSATLTFSLVHLTHFKDGKKISYFFLITYMSAHYLQSYKFYFLLKFSVTILLCNLSVRSIPLWGK